MQTLNERKDRTMSEERYAIIFSSRTGNTRKLADTIRGALPDARCAYFGEAKSADPDAEMIYVGFWTDKGTADQACLEQLGRLRNKKIFLFGTAGFGGSEAYYQKILANVRTAIDASNTVVGEYMCQGRMPQAVRDHYVKMKEMPDAKPNLDGADRELRSGAFPPGSGGSGKTAEDDYRVKASFTCLNGNYPCIQNGTCLMSWIFAY